MSRLEKLVADAGHALAVAILREGITAAETSGTQGREIVVAVDDGTVSVTLSTTPAAAAGSAPMRPDHRPALTPAQRAIVAMLDVATPRKLEWLWLKSGKSAPGKQISGSFKQMCADLCRMGVARHLPRAGYLLVSASETIA
jgi:hypothetical protein